MKHEGFTPGPWTLQPNGSVYIGRPHWEHGACYVNAANPADNALIAAAPALLAENERLRELLEKALPSVICAGMTTGNGNPLVKEIRAALAGGRGEK